MIRIAFNDDGSEYAWQLRQELERKDVYIQEFRTSDEIFQVIGETIRLILVVNPTLRLVKGCLNALAKAGGEMRKVPLIAGFSAPLEVPDDEIFAVVDDFVVQPAKVEEIILRADAHRRKIYGRGQVIQRENLLINVDNHQVFLDGKPLDFTYKEFELLKTLAENPGRVYRREELLQMIWGEDYYGGTRTVDVHIRRVRAKIEVNRKFVETVHAVGYRFVQID